MFSRALGMGMEMEVELGAGINWGIYMSMNNPWTQTIVWQRLGRSWCGEEG